MEGETSRKGTTIGGLALAVVLAAAVGIGGIYLYVQMTVKEEGTPEPMPAQTPTAAPAAVTPTAAPPPLKIEFLGAGKVNAGKASSPDGKETADLAPNDAMVIWIKMEGGPRRQREAPRQQAGSAAGAPLPTGGPVEVGPMASLPEERGSNLPISLKDDQGRTYAFAAERKDDDLVAIHVRKGYDVKPKFLEVSQLKDGKVVESWKVEDVPAPVEVLPAAALTGQPEGEIRLQPDSKGRLGAIVHLNTPVKQNEGLIVWPVSASYVPLSSELTPDGVIAKPGRAFEGRIFVPNAGMQKFVAVDVQRYEAVAKVETVAFKTARIEVVFDQPTLMVDKPETVVTPSGIPVTLRPQVSVPKRKPDTIRPKVLFDIAYDGTKIPKSTVPGVDTISGIQLVGPAPADFGLEDIVFRQINSAQLPGNLPYRVLELPAGPSLAKKAGTFKSGPINLTVQLVTVTPKLLEKRRVVLPVNPTPIAPK